LNRKLKLTKEKVEIF